MQYLNKKIKCLLNDDLKLLSYELDDLTNLSLQLVNANANMRLCLRINTIDATAQIVFMSGEELDDEEWYIKAKIQH